MQTEATYEAEIINTLEHLNKNYTEDHFVNIVNSTESNQPNINLTIKAAEKFPEELKLSNENSNTKK